MLLGMSMMDGLPSLKLRSPQLLAGKEIAGYHRQRKASKKEKLISKYRVSKKVKLFDV